MKKLVAGVLLCAVSALFASGCGGGDTKKTPAKTEPAKTEPAKTEPAKTEPAK